MKYWHAPALLASAAAAPASLVQSPGDRPGWDKSYPPKEKSSGTYHGSDDRLRGCRDDPILGRHAPIFRGTPAPQRSLAFPAPTKSLRARGQGWHGRQRVGPMIEGAWRVKVRLTARSCAHPVDRRW